MPIHDMGFASVGQPILPDKTQGYDKIWLVGISLGGLGAILYAIDHGEDIRGIMLLAPFLGEEAIVREIAGAGGLKMWEPGDVVEDDYQRKLWQWIRRYALEGSEAPIVYLGYGEQDSFAPANRLLAEVIPQERVLTTTGAHDWHTWKRLWDGFLTIHARAKD